MDKIKFANGEEHNCTFFSTIPGMAFIATDDLSAEEATALFSDPEKTAVIEHGYYRLIGYTQLESVTEQPYGVQAILTGGHDERRQ